MRSSQRRFSLCCKATAALTELGNVNINIDSVDGVPTSDTLSNRLIADGIPILFGTGPGEGGALATFNTFLDVITIDNSFLNDPDEVLAAILSHETFFSAYRMACSTCSISASE